MRLGKHQKTGNGRFRKERADSLILNLRKEYPVLKKLHGNIKTLGGAEKALGVDSLSKLLAKARRME